MKTSIRLGKSAGILLLLLLASACQAVVEDPTVPWCIEGQPDPVDAPLSAAADESCEIRPLAVPGVRVSVTLSEAEYFRDSKGDLAYSKHRDHYYSTATSPGRLKVEDFLAAHDDSLAPLRALRAAATCGHIQDLTQELLASLGAPEARLELHLTRGKAWGSNFDVLLEIDADQAPDCFRKATGALDEEPFANEKGLAAYAPRRLSYSILSNPWLPGQFDETELNRQVRSAVGALLKDLLAAQKQCARELTDARLLLKGTTSLSDGRIGPRS